MGCRKGSRLGSERMAVRIRETKSKTWDVFYLRRASLGGNCDNAGEEEEGMQRNADIAYQLSIWCGAEERYGTP